jgi:hypothetical protein
MDSLFIQDNQALARGQHARFAQARAEQLKRATSTEKEL